jgi:hypothetical protein
MPDSPRIALVCWLDASWERGEIKPADVRRPVQLESVGFVLHDDEQGITLGSDCDDQGVYRFVLAVPRAAVRWVRELRQIEEP